MSNYRLNTPRTTGYRLFEQESPERHTTLQQTPYLTFTPCTRLSRMTIDSQSNGLTGRTRSNIFQLPVTNFNEKLMEVVKEEESSHPNLTMFLGEDKISLFDKKKNAQQEKRGSSIFSDDEESDEGDIFSSSLCPMSTSPETTTSIFNPRKQSIFDENTSFEQVFPLTDHDQYYDPTNSWVFNIYQDDDNNDEQTFINNNSSSNSSSNSNNNSSQEEEDEEDENRAPRIWKNRKDYNNSNNSSSSSSSSSGNEQKKMKPILSASHEQDNTSYKRLPLQEIRLEDYVSDDEPPARKKISVADGNTHKIRFIRTLSPTRNAKRKGKEIAENIMPN